MFLNFYRTGVAFLAAALVIGVLFSSCKRGGLSGDLSVAQTSIVVLKPELIGSGSSIDMLFHVFPQAAFISYEKFAENLPSLLNQRRLVVVPDSASAPVEYWKLLNNFVERGGAIMLLGKAPFSQRVFDNDGRIMPESLLHELMIKRARSVRALSDIQLWRHENDSDVMRGSVGRLRDIVQGWGAVKVEADETQIWDQMTAHENPSIHLTAKDNSLVFLAKGDEGTTRLLVVCEDESGQRWGHPIKVGDDWEGYVLHEARFRPLRLLDRGIESQSPGLSLSQSVSISIGVDLRYVSQDPGALAYAISDVRFGHDPRPVDYVTGRVRSFPAFMDIARYRIEPTSIRNVVTDDFDQISGLEVESPFSGPTGSGGAGAVDYRWIPLYEAIQEVPGAEAKAWPASVYLVPGEGGRLGRWGWLGMDMVGKHRDLVAEILLALQQELQQGRYLLSAGTRYFSIESDEFLTSDIEYVLDENTDSEDHRVVAELLNLEGHILRRFVSPRLRTDKPGALSRITMSLGAMSFQKSDKHNNNYIVRASLESTGGRGHLYDQIDQVLKVLPPAGGKEKFPEVSIRGERFATGRNPRFQLGVEYQPMGLGPLSRRESSTDWMEAGFFEPIRIQRDLAQIKRLGFTIIGLKYTHTGQIPQLRFMLREAAEHGLRVNLHLPMLDPMRPGWNEALALLDTLGKEYLGPVLSLEAGRNLKLGKYEQRKALDPHWRDWLFEQFGNVTNVENYLQRPVWREHEMITGPPDSELEEDGSHRKSVSLYRRFVDDYVSRRTGLMVRRLRDAGYDKYVCRSGGASGNHAGISDALFPIDLASGAVHLDFVMPSARGLFGSLDQFYEAGFISTYGRGISGGKPVLWSDFGVVVNSDGEESELENQSRLHLNMFVLSTRSDSAGFFARSFGFRPYLNHGRDEALINPDGTVRPAGNAYKGFAHRLRDQSFHARSWKGRELDRFVDARGFSGIWDSWKQVYEKEMRDGFMEEIRPVGYGSTTRSMALASPGGGRFDNPSPIQGVNGEWGRIRSEGLGFRSSLPPSVRMKVRDRITMELINTGAVRWDKSYRSESRRVWIKAEREGGGEQFVNVPGLAFGETGEATWIPSTAGVWKLRPHIRDVGSFGQELTVVVQ